MLKNIIVISLCSLLLLIQANSFAEAQIKYTVKVEVLSPVDTTVKIGNQSKQSVKVTEKVNDMDMEDLPRATFNITGTMGQEFKVTCTLKDRTGNAQLILEKPTDMPQRIRCSLN